MKNFAYLLLLLALPMTACAQAGGQPDDSDARKARIVENLKYHFPQLSQAQVQTVEVRFDSTAGGFDVGMLVINGQDAQPFVVSQDDGALFFTQAGPFNVSMDADGLVAEMARRETQERTDALQRHEQIMAEVANLPVRGNPDAEVTIVEFSDFQCPFCARVVPTVEQVMEADENVNFVFVHYPLPNHPWARPASIAAVCASNQSDDAYWALHDFYFENQPQFDPSNVLLRSRGFLADKSIDLEQWQACASDTSSEAHQRAVQTVEANLALGQRMGITGTPGFFINGREASGAIPAMEFENIIRQARADAGGE